MTGRCGATVALAIAELTIRIERETLHASAALRAWRRAGPGDRIRRGGRSDNAQARHWRRARRHFRAVAAAQLQLTWLLTS